MYTGNIEKCGCFNSFTCLSMYVGILYVYKYVYIHWGERGMQYTLW